MQDSWRIAKMVVTAGSIHRKRFQIRHQVVHWGKHRKRSRIRLRDDSVFIHTFKKTNPHSSVGWTMFVLMRKKCPQNTGWVHIDWEKLLSFPPNHLHLPLSPVFVSNWRLECHRRVKSRNVLLEVMAETWMSSLIASLMSRLICISPPTCKTGCNMFLLPDVLNLDTVGICVDVALPSWAPLVDMVHCIRLRLE